MFAGGNSARIESASARTGIADAGGAGSGYMYGLVGKTPINLLMRILSQNLSPTTNEFSPNMLFHFMRLLSSRIILPYLDLDL